MKEVLIELERKPILSEEFFSIWSAEFNPIRIQREILDSIGRRRPDSAESRIVQLENQCLEVRLFNFGVIR